MWLLLLLGVVAFDVYFYLEKWIPLQRQYKELKLKQERLEKKVIPLFNSLVESLKTERVVSTPPQLLKGLKSKGSVKHVAFPTLTIFRKYSDAFTDEGKKLLDQTFSQLKKKGVKSIEIRLYEGPYRKLTSKRLVKLKKFARSYGFKVSVFADNTISRWTLQITIKS